MSRNLRSLLSLKCAELRALLEGAELLTIRITSLAMGTLWLYVISFLLFYTRTGIHGKEPESLQELERILTSKIEDLQRVVLGQGEQIHQLESELKRLNDTNHLLAEKIDLLEKDGASPNTGIGGPSGFFQKVPRTCDELRTLNPFAQSGLYSIDPDGPNNGEEPIQVFCNTTTGTTQVSHDSDNVLEVSKCSSPGCYTKEIKYNASATQIAALINLSKSCKQFFQFDCIAAPLEFRNKNYAWWNDRNGVARYAWAGDNATAEHTCECGLDNSCSEPSLKCNCDSLAPELQTDEGYITDMSSLPVMKLNFGRNKYSTSKASYTLGKLECSGRHQLKDEPSSCEDLWRSGSTLSGIVLLQINNSLTTVFCDFSKIPGQPGFENRIGILDTKKPPVMFQAFLTQRQREGAVQFENITVNVGNAFDSRVFTVPVSGVYSFKVKGCMENCHYGGCGPQIYKNDTVVLQAQSVYSSSERYGQIFLSLEPGDQISVRNPQGYIIPGNDINDPSRFSGYLLYEYPF